MGDLRKRISDASPQVSKSKTSNSAVGSTAVWDGPPVPKGPFGKGSSSGAHGISLLAKNAPGYIPGPITQIAKEY